MLASSPTSPDSDIRIYGCHTLPVPPFSAFGKHPHQKSKHLSDAHRQPIGHTPDDWAGQHAQAFVIKTWDNVWLPRTLRMYVNGFGVVFFCVVVFLSSVTELTFAKYFTACKALSGIFSTFKSKKKQRLTWLPLSTPHFTNEKATTQRRAPKKRPTWISLPNTTGSQA